MNVQATMGLLDGSWGEGSLPITEWIGFGGALLVSLFVLARVVLGALQAGRFDAQQTLDSTARKALEAEIAEAETHTTGEIAVVVLERSDRHPAAHWMSGLLFVILGSAVATQWMPWDSPALFYAVQFGFGALGLVLALLVPGFRRGFVTEERATEMATEQCLQEFYSLGLHRTADQTGVLLFVSLFERRVIVLGDSGIDAKVDLALWEGARNAVLEGVKAGDLQQGLHSGLERIGAVLAEHFPLTGDNPNELPNHVIVRRE